VVSCEGEMKHNENRRDAVDGLPSSRQVSCVLVVGKRRHCSQGPLAARMRRAKIERARACQLQLDETSFAYFWACRGDAPVKRKGQHVLVIINALAPA